MDRSLSSLVFNGSIIEAITEAKKQKKLFVVYVSGQNIESNHMETSTWLDPRVADSISKYSILLHILEGSADAGNFSALYPQKTAPCITAVGYNGVQLWQHEGFVSADVLVSSLEKAWLSLHVQETTATLLTAALASKKELMSGASSVSSEIGSSSRAQIPSHQAEIQIPPAATTSNNSQIVEEEEDHGHAVTEVDSRASDMASHGSADAIESRIGEFNESPAPVTIAEKPLDLVEVDTTKNESESSMSKDNSDLCDQHIQRNEPASGGIAQKAKEVLDMDILEDAASEKTGFLDSSSNTCHDVSLSIRLPDGSSILVKFLIMDTLKMVKDFVDKNRTSSFGSYDLAVPYPRKVFGDEDLDRTLSDLGLHNRQALIVVLRNKVNTSFHAQSSSTESNPSASGSNEGYFAIVRRVLSYVNPFSYFGGDSNSSNTAQDSQNSIWQYGPNLTPQNDQTVAARPYQTPVTTTGNNRGRKPASSHFGSNIHTLKRDEDDNGFGDRNAFWNGNSTQFGGNDNNK